MPLTAMANTSQRGDLAEEYLASVVSIPLLRDFVHLRPYQKKERQRREVCDLLIEYGSELFPIQMKVHGSDRLLHSEDITDRVRKKMRGGISQLKGAVKTLLTYQSHSIHEIRGEVTFLPTQRVQHGLVLVEYEGAPFDHGGIGDIRLGNRAFLHSMSISDFIYICEQLHTLPDVMTYLRERVKIPAWHRPYFGDEKKILAYYMTTGSISFNVSRDEFDQRMIVFSEFMGSRSEDVQENKYYLTLFDGLIAQLRNSDPNYKDYYPDEAGEQTPEILEIAAVEGARMLNSFRVSERREAIKMYLEKMKKPDFGYFARDIIVEEDDVRNPQEGVLFLAGGMPRSDRIRFLYGLCEFASIWRSYKRVLGVATENVLGNDRSWDFIVYERGDREFPPKDYEQASKMFKDPEYRTTHNFSSDGKRLILR